MPPPPLVTTPSLKMYKNNRGTFLPGEYLINGTNHTFKITKRTKWSVNCKGSTYHYDATHTGMRIYWDEEQQDHYIMIQIQHGSAYKVHWKCLVPRGLVR